MHAFRDSIPTMNRVLTLRLVPIFFLSLIAGRAGTPEKETVVEQPPAKPAEPWQISVGGPGWLVNANGFTGFHGVNPSVSESGNFLNIPTLFLRSAAKLK
jgi:hypothetical protein